MVKRGAFTMIELIFAIVIMAIVIIALPRVMQTNSNALEANINQEAIFGASATMVQALSYPWDTNSPGHNGSYDKIVAIPGGTAIYDRYNNKLHKYDKNSSFRIGAILEPGHRRFHEYNASDANISGLETNSSNPLCYKGSNIVYFNNYNPLQRYKRAQGYKRAYESSTTVSYIPDNANGVFVFKKKGSQTTPTNMKMVTVTVKLLNAVTKKPIVRLRSYTANIGETDFASRVY